MSAATYIRRGLSEHESDNGKCIHKLIFGDNCPCPRFEGIIGRTNPHMQFKEEKKSAWG